MTDVKDKYRDYRDRFDIDSSDISQKYIKGFLLGVLIISLGFNALQYSEGREDFISPQEAGQKTVSTINSNILEPSPNEVQAELVNVTSATEIGLENFYRVRINVTNPAGSQITSVYAKKDGSIVFLQFPRQLGDQFQKGRYH